MRFFLSFSNTRFTRYTNIYYNRKIDIDCQQIYSYANKERDRHVDRSTDRQNNGQRDRQVDTQTERQTNRKITRSGKSKSKYSVISHFFFFYKTV